MPKVYLDKGALSDLWRSKKFSGRDLLRLRRRLSSTRFSRRPQVVLGPKVISELAQLEGREQFFNELAFLRGLPDLLYLSDVRRRVNAEVAVALGGIGNPWCATEELEGLFLAAGDPRMWAAERKRLASDKREFGRRKRRGKADFQYRHPTRKEQSEAAKRFYEAPADLVAYWGTEQLKRNRVLLGLPEGQEKWPAPSSLPTIWGAAAYHSARDYLVMRDGRSIDENDQTDAWHYAAAMYADDLVLTDKKFRQIASVCPPPGPSVKSFEEWAAGILSAT